MKNTKTFSLLASLALLSTVCISPALAASEYLPDVENVTAVAVSDGVELTWDSADGADQYTLYYGLESINVDGANYEESVLLDDVTSYIVTELAPATEYYFAIAADDSTGTYFGSFNYSEEVSATTLALEEDVIIDPVFEDLNPVIDPLADPVLDPFNDPVLDPLADPVLGSDTDLDSDLDLGNPWLEEVDLGSEQEALDPIEELVGDPLYSSAGDSGTAPENLPKSGPATAVVFLVSGTGAYFWRKYQR